MTAGACALGPDVAAGWRVGGGWRWRDRLAHGDRLARGFPAVPLLRYDFACGYLVVVSYDRCRTGRSIAGAGALVKFFFFACFLSRSVL